MCSLDVLLGAGEACSHAATGFDENGAGVLEAGLKGLCEDAMCKHAVEGDQHLRIRGGCVQAAVAVVVEGFAMLGKSLVWKVVSKSPGVV